MNASTQLFDGTGKRIRLGRVLNPKDHRAAVVAFDHGLHVGVIPGVDRPGEMLETLAEAGADAVLAYMFIGYEDAGAEVEQVEAVAHMVRACDALGIGCIIEPMARGKQADPDSYRSDYIALGVRIACEMGADLLKTDYSGSAETFRQATQAAFRPILIAGGPKTATLREPLEMVRGALDAGASGMFIGRNVFQAADPAKTMRVLRRVIHDNVDVDTALEAMHG